MRELEIEPDFAGSAAALALMARLDEDLLGGEGAAEPTCVDATGGGLPKGRNLLGLQP